MSILNKNLDLDITDYVAINFGVTVDVIDALRGVDVEVTNEEAGYINRYIDELNNVTGHKSKHITKGGTYTLDGVQATAYARIRYTAGGDWKRTERQRMILGLAAEKAKTLSLGELNKLLDTVLGEISTNLNKKDIASLMSRALSYEIDDTVGWPYEVGDYKDASEIWYGPPVNLENQVIKLHQFLFDEEDYIPSTTVQSISKEIIRRTGVK